MGFVAQNEEWTTDFSGRLDTTFAYGSNKEDTSLAKFLMRPVKVKEYNWNVGGSLDSTFNPWTEFFNDPAVASRITNYYLIRCNLHIKVLVNGTPFHYGRAMVSYKPLEDYETTATPTTIHGLLMQYSQRPLIYVNPTTSVGGSIKVPFMWNENYFTIPNTSWTTAGKLRVSSFGNLKHANAGSTPVNISIFAWAEDLVLTQTTDAAYAPQSGVVKEAVEFESAPVSTVASAVADVAGALKKYKVIAPFAKATEIGAKAVANIARIFGYARPQVLDKLNVYKPRLNGNMTNSDQNEALVKLSLDSKNELSVDPNIVGLQSVDELLIASLVQRPSYLTNFAWDQGDSSGTFLFNVTVSPAMWYYDAANGEYNLTPLAFVSQPFQYWTGTVVYRFQVVASAYHKGRIRISYDPNGGSGAQAAFNTVISRVLDISHETEAIMEIPWAQAKPFASVRPVTTNVNEWSSSIQFTGRSVYDNGTLSVHVLNELVTPDSSLDNDISVNVFVYAKDDLEFAGPILSNISDLSYFRQQSGLEPVDDELQPDIGSEMPSKDLGLVYMGERVTSIRALMKRYSLHSVECIEGVAAANNLYLRRIVRSSTPNHRGYDPQGIDTAANQAVTLNVPYNWSNMTYITYFMPAFTAWRGSIRTKYVPTYADSLPRNMSVSRIGPSSFSRTNHILMDTAWTNNKLLRESLVSSPTGDGGLHTNLVTVSGALEVELPYYNNYRFSYARNLNINNGLATDGTDSLYVSEISLQNQGTLQSYDRYVATGEDFSLFGFMNVPLIFSYATPASNVPL